MTDQLKHCKVTQLSTNKSFYLSMICGTNKSFYLSMICGMNHELQREQLWLDLNDISHSMEDAWCLMGDFNTIRFKEYRLGGNDVQDHDVKELASLLETCKFHELKSTGAYYSWTNKTIWSRIDHAFPNDYWYDVFDYTYSYYLANSLSDHTSVLLQFPTSPRPITQFQYCEITIAESKEEPGAETAGKSVAPMR
ncbi:hypothetical protein Cgig2_013894 [Carnegiea gigantea]|uniref:Endonuclease/exonuclease/phosphatase domain-containing protein n=1 Tax=Carnegiea gigantea TaxID=171969 RepID=A0A9Q1GYA0_9CARY|nr:hypothetical protein Cgig2_013894 [Carnegiea gigantea]